MSTIIQQPDTLNLSGNLKKFIVSSAEEISFVLQQGSTVLLEEIYQPDASGMATIDVKAVIDRLLEITLPTTGGTFVQTAGIGDFTATIDTNSPITFTVVKGGVAELAETAESWLSAHLLTWQIQEKFILQVQPEWIGVYAVSSGSVVALVYAADGSSSTITLASLAAGALYSVDASWGAITSLSGVQAIAWDVWFDVGGTRMTPIQRYQLRNAGSEEHMYVWTNTLGGIDSVSFTGALEDDQKLTHQTALENYDEETISEYDIIKDHEIRQSTGYLTDEEGFWIKDFFYSRKKHVVRPDGSIRQISVVSSKILSVSSDDECDFEFTYRMGSDYQLLNLDRTNTTLPAPEGLADFFLTNLLSSLTEASYADNLILAIQSPFAVGWQKISLSQLGGGALPALIDNVTIKLINGKLTAIFPEDIDVPVDPNTGGGTGSDSRTELIDGAIIWDSGLTYNSTIINYKILGVTYSANAKTLTLQPSDPTLNRIECLRK